MRSPVPYFGSKAKLADRLVQLMPAHSHYVEPFCGSLAVLFAKPPSDHETVNDADRKLMTFWRMLRERPDDVARVCALTPHSRAEYDLAVEREGDDLDDLELARLVFVRLSQSRTARLVRTGWRHYVNPAGSTVSMPGYLRGYVDRMAACVERLQRVSLECRPALDLIRKYGAERDVLLYVDPPYLGSTRANDNAYRVEMRTPEEHAELAGALLACNAAVVLSGYPSPLYDELYADWSRVEIPTATGQGGKWEDRTEVVWSNRPIAEPNLLDLIEEAS